MRRYIHFICAGVAISILESQLRGARDRAHTFQEILYLNIYIIRKLSNNKRKKTGA